MQLTHLELKYAFDGFCAVCELHEYIGADVHVEHEIEKDKQIAHNETESLVAERALQVRFFFQTNSQTQRRTYTRPLTWSSLIAIRRASYKIREQSIQMIFSP